MSEPVQGLKDVASQALVSLIQSATDAMTFLKGEVPIAVRELLTYYTALYVAQIAAGALALSFALFAWRWSIRAYKVEAAKGGYTHEENYGICAGGAAFLGVVAIALSAVVLSDLLKITLAPRIWLLEYASHLVK